MGFSSQDTGENDVGRVDRRVAVGREPFAEALSACADALQYQLQMREKTESLRTSVAVFAQLAHREEVPPERTLAAFKKMLQQLPAVRQEPVDKRGALIAQLAQMAIEAYYDGRDGQTG